MNGLMDRPGRSARGRAMAAPRVVPIGSPARAGRARGCNAAPARAFSLLELTLVIAIIAALMGVATFALMGQSTRAKITTTQSSMRTIQTAINQYQLNHGVYPDTLARLTTTNPPYLEPRPMDDGWKRPLYYRVPGLAGRPFSLMSGGADGDLGTPADNIDVWTMDAANAAGGQ